MRWLRGVPTQHLSRLVRVALVATFLLVLHRDE